MEIQRQFYLDELIRKQGNGFVKIITGLRRCGKSYLLRTIFKKHLLDNGIKCDKLCYIVCDIHTYCTSPYGGHSLVKS